MGQPQSDTRLRMPGIRTIIRVVWVLGGLLFLVWLYDSFRARDVDSKLLQSNDSVAVSSTPESLSFTPVTAAAKVGLLFFPGGGVEPEAYAPLVSAVARQGYPSVIIRLPYRFAPFAEHRKEACHRAHEWVARQPQVAAWVVAGHSKGGAIATELVSAQPTWIRGLILIGTTHPKELDLSKLSIPVKKIFGSQDGIATEEKTLANRSKLPTHAQWVRIAGGNHSQFGYYGLQLRDRKAAITREVQQRLTLTEIISTLEAATRSLNSPIDGRLPQ